MENCIHLSGRSNIGDIVDTIHSALVQPRTYVTVTRHKTALAQFLVALYSAATAIEPHRLPCNNIYIHSSITHIAFATTYSPLLSTSPNDHRDHHRCNTCTYSPIQPTSPLQQSIVHYSGCKSVSEAAMNYLTQNLRQGVQGPLAVGEERVVLSVLERRLRVQAEAARDMFDTQKRCCCLGVGGVPSVIDHEISERKLMKIMSAGPVTPNLNAVRVNDHVIPQAAFVDRAVEAVVGVCVIEFGPEKYVADPSVNQRSKVLVPHVPYAVAVGKKVFSLHLARSSIEIVLHRQ